MARWFRFRFAEEAFDVARAIETSPVLKRLKGRLVKLHGPHGEEVIEDMVTWVMRAAGDHYVTVRGKQIDRIFKLRTELEEVFQKVMKFGDDAPSKAEIEAHLAKIVKQYKDLDEALADASKPLEPFVLPPAERDAFAKHFADQLTDARGKPLKGFAEQPTQATRPHSADFADARGKMPGEKGYNPKQSRAYVKDWREDPARPGVFLRTFDGDGSSAELKVVDGSYHLTSTGRDGTQVTIVEGQVNLDPYVRKTSTTSLMNAHHGVQAHPMQQKFGAYGYNPDAAPTIWLRNGRAGSPHGRITAVEGRTGLHPNEPGSKLTAAEIGSATYADMRRTAAREMRTSHLTEQQIREFLTAHDRYFIDNILPNIPTAKRPSLLGAWSPNLPGALP